MNPADDTSAPNNTESDLAALNAAIAEAEANPEESLEVPVTPKEEPVDVNNLPSDEEAAAVAAAPVVPEEIPAEPAKETAGFVDGDLADEPKEEAASAPAAPAPDYDALNADPIADFDATDTHATASAAVDMQSKSEEAEAKKKAKKNFSIDTDSILHSNGAIIGIVVGVVVVIVVIALVAALNA